MDRVGAIGYREDKVTWTTDDNLEETARLSQTLITNFRSDIALALS